MSADECEFECEGMCLALDFCEFICPRAVKVGSLFECHGDNNTLITPEEYDERE